MPARRPGRGIYSTSTVTGVLQRRSNGYGSVAQRIERAVSVRVAAAVAVVIFVRGVRTLS
jgi:hypothetical protein